MATSPGSVTGRQVYSLRSTPVAESTTWRCRIWKHGCSSMEIWANCALTNACGWGGDGRRAVSITNLQLNDGYQASEDMQQGIDDQPR